MQPDVSGELTRRVEALSLTDQQAAAALVGALLVVAVGFLAYRWLRRPAGERFAAVLAEHEEVAVLLHPNPDADAMAAALGVARIARHVDTDATLQFSGQIRRQENRAFRTVLDVEMESLDHVSQIDAEAVVLVDHNEPRGFTGADGVLPACVVDHHPGGGGGEEFTDVRTEYGATSSIVTEYLNELGATPVPPDRHDSEVEPPALPTLTATGLLYGILSDTNRLTRGVCPADFEAASYLHPGVDQDLLTRIADPEVSTETLEVKARAIAGRDVRGSFAVSDVGAVSNVDAIPQAADELVGLEGVTAVVVLGERDGTVHLSGRSRDDRVHMGRTLAAAVGDLANASAGGHARMGGGQIPPAVQADGTREVSAPRGDALLDRLFDAMSGDV
ncbi:DHH family phosphoesterase [Halorarum salinum]|uniref:Bifunctional oligoribonuclease/PAP phosphatase NrnA n=1 Tax=Halorarum salinum TaxID=2743089 RepID=A0A7D5LC03_9EURY|nr:bifunctional oligoribonuclease/PAP phosphatase NrnA [Halobaculum salinum]QLG62990.1 bifunctional oligoribonuclease/PAP phosphatase NrnA [Halobaculum salinum]